MSYQWRKVCSMTMSMSSAAHGTPADANAESRCLPRTTCGLWHEDHPRTAQVSEARNRAKCIIIYNRMHNVCFYGRYSIIGVG